MQLLVAPLFCLFAAAAEAADARQVVAALHAAPPQLVVEQQQQQHQRQQPGHVTAAAAAGAAATARPGSTGFAGQQQQATTGSSESDVLSAVVAAFSPMLSVPLTLGLQYTNSGVLSAVALLGCAVLWPSLLNLVYLLVVCWGIACWGWGSAKTWTSAPWVILLQAFAGVHLLLLYLAQLPLLQLPALDLACDLLGLYNLSRTAEFHPDARGICVVQITHLVFLHLLYVGLGFYVGLLRQPLYLQLAAAVREVSKSSKQQPSLVRRVRRSRFQEGLLEPLLVTDDADVELAQQQQQQQGSGGQPSQSGARGGAAAAAAAGAGAGAAQAPVRRQQQQQQQCVAVPVGASSVLSARPLSLRGLIRGERQDWNPIQRFIDGSWGPQGSAMQDAGQQQPPQGAAAAVAAAPPPEPSTGGARTAGSSSVGVAAAAPTMHAAGSVPAGGFSDMAGGPVSNNSGSLSGSIELPRSQSGSEDGTGLFTPGPVQDSSSGAAQQQRRQGSSSAQLPAATAADGAVPSAVFSPAAGIGGHNSSSSSTMGRWDQAMVLLQVLLPFTVGCGEFLLRQLLAVPAVAGIAIAAFALVQVSAVRCCASMLCFCAVLCCVVPLYWSSRVLGRAGRPAASAVVCCAVLCCAFALMHMCAVLRAEGVLKHIAVLRPVLG